MENQFENIDPKLFIKERLEQYRKQAGKGKNQIAAASGVDPATYGRYEKGEMKPRFRTITKFAEVLGISIDQLFLSKQEADQLVNLWQQAYGWSDETARALLELPLGKLDLLRIAAENRVTNIPPSPLTPEYIAHELMDHPPYINVSALRVFHSFGIPYKNEAELLSSIGSKAVRPITELRYLTVSGFNDCWKDFETEIKDRWEVLEPPAIINREMELSEFPYPYALICSPRAVVMGSRAWNSDNPQLMVIGKKEEEIITISAMARLFDNLWDKNSK